MPHSAMMAKKVLLTGSNGTVAPVLAAELRSRGWEVAGWDRRAVRPEDAAAVTQHLRTLNPEAVVHCALGDPAWAETMARFCAEEGRKFLFTGSVSVFGPHQTGPFDVGIMPEPTDDYGRYKLECERRVREANAEAIVVRLGWQIGRQPGGNHMVDYLARRQAEDGFIAASTRWFQACSFLEDSVRGLAEVLENFPSGLYHLDGNPGWSFFEIVTALRRALGRSWEVRASDDVALNNLMHDSMLKISSIDRRLGAFNVCRR